MILRNDNQPVADSDDHALYYYASRGYEIHGRTHSTLVEKARQRGLIIGIIATACAGIALDVLRMVL